MCSLSLVCVNKKTRPVDTSDGECTENGNNSFVVSIQRLSVKKLSPKAECFVVISHLKLDPYENDLLYVGVVNSSNNTTKLPRVSYFPVNHSDQLCFIYMFL